MHPQVIRVVIRHIGGEIPCWKVLGPGWTEIAVDPRGAVAAAAERLGDSVDDDSYQMVVLWMDVPEGFSEPDMDDFETSDQFTGGLVC